MLLKWDKFKYNIISLIKFIMFSSCLLSGLIISVISTGIYILLTDNKEYTDRKLEYCKLFCSILFVSIGILYLTGGKKDKLIPVSREANIISNPPF